MKIVRLAIAVLALLYPLFLAALALTMQEIGERWWLVGATLYLPRIVWAAPLPFLVVALVAARRRALLWSQAAAALLLLFPLLGFVVPGPRGAGASPRLRILSYNVNSSFGGPENIVAEIDRYSPDVVVLQETWSSEGTARLLRDRYPVVETSTQFILASRYPVSSTTDPPKIDHRGQERSPRFIEQVLDTPLGAIRLYNVHPLSPRQALYTIRGTGLSHEIPSGHVFSSGNGAVFEENADLRELQIRAVSEAARSESGPVIIAGDTNLPDLSFVLHRYLSGYQDGFAKAGWGFGYTFPDYRWPWMRIDRILASDHFRFVGFQVGTSRASDHLCVVADLQRRDP
jgi:endonuclease/exonuclease/phosphatase (EEP) superfamily protein YafD